MTKRLTYNFVKEKIESYGYKLLSKEYINASEKLVIMCDKDHVYKTKYDVFNRGHRCNICSTKRTADKQRHSIEFIRKEIEKVNYQLLSNKYKNAGTTLKIICDKGHIFKTYWNNFQSGSRCPVCFGTPKKTIEEIKIFAKNIGYKLISKKYINVVEKIDFECDKGHIFKVTWNNFGGINGSRCPICWLEEKRRDIELLSEWKKYLYETYNYTNNTLKEYGYKIKNLDLRGRTHGYDLDHKYSIYDGFENNINPEIIGHWKNLEILKDSENRSKGKNSSISLNELLNIIKEL